MNYARIALASLGATIAYFAFGFVMFGALPAMKSEFMKYPNVYRSREDMMKVMPYSVVAILISIVVVAVLYAKIYPAGGGSVRHIPRRTHRHFLGLHLRRSQLRQPEHRPRANALPGITYFIEWVIVGTAIGIIYKPS